ncbi:MAG: hypothetical protein FWD57_02700, partial [Polyangiaceae bacterium]|nr:hypothetical protein [Polyangiaceae bacterium]
TAAGLVWAVVAYVIRMYITLLVEPEVNPLKHFPVVTVAQKFSISVADQLFKACAMVFSPLGPIIGGPLAVITAYLIPSVSGFFAWELKENYKLYTATRSDKLKPAIIGSHGETMRGLLVAGVHSGTLPNLYNRMRRTALREHERLAARGTKPRDSKPKEASGVGKFQEGLADVERAVRRFVERELVAHVDHSAQWSFGQLTVENVDLSPNRIRIQIKCSQLSDEACEIAIEHQSGAIVAGFMSPGFVSRLQQLSLVGSTIFENALAGFYHRAEVDMVRDQLRAELGEETHYEIGEKKLTCWLGRDYCTEWFYRIDGRRPKAIAPTVKGVKPPKSPPVLDTRRVLYRHQQISWVSWEVAWDAASQPVGDIAVEAPISVPRTAVPRLLTGTSLLPRVSGSYLPTSPSQRFGDPRLHSDYGPSSGAIGAPEQQQLWSGAESQDGATVLSQGNENREIQYLDTVFMPIPSESVQRHHE